MKDPIVEEVRKVRQKHANHFSNNLDYIFDDIIEHQKQYSNRLVRLKARRVSSVTYKNSLTVPPPMLAEKHAEYNEKSGGK